MSTKVYSSPNSEVISIRTEYFLLASSSTQSSDKKDSFIPANSTKVEMPLKPLKMGKLIILATKPRTLLSKVKVSINGETIETIKDKGKFVFQISNDCEVDFKWTSAFSKKSISAKSNEIKVVKMTYGQMNINLEEIVYARDGVKLYTEDTNKKSNTSGLKAGLKVAGLAVGVIAALAGADDAFGGDLDGDFNMDDDMMGGDALDLDGDGVVDAIGVDVDGDGVYDSIAVDSNGDGLFDTVMADSDGDGMIDSMLRDTNGDGIVDSIGIDSDGDGLLDQVGFDSNGDGSIDTVAIDTDKDGLFDIAGIDTNGDGIIDDSAFL